MAQDYQDEMEVIVLEDSGVFGNETIEIAGPQDRNFTFRIVSTAKHYPSVGAKRNVLFGLAKHEFIVTADDDDTYFPWHVSASVNALEKGKYAQPRQALEWQGNNRLTRHWVVSQRVLAKLQNNVRLSPVEALDICYGGQWSFRKSIVLECGGYPEQVGNGDDTALCRELVTRFGNSVDTICDEFPNPSYIYSRSMSGSWHASEFGAGTEPLNRLHSMPRAKPSDLKIQLPNWYWTVKIPDLVRPRKW
jgi:hypothetical protein